MNETILLREINQDLQVAPSRVVVYLEGKTDLPIFFALLGVRPPTDGIHSGVLVRGLRDSGAGGSASGGSAVRMRVEAAVRNGYAGIFGITDGDGDALATLGASFSAPFLGPAFRWPAYCIENLLVKTGWPFSTEPPDWTRVLCDHVPYVGLNRLHKDLLQSLRTLRLATHQRPVREEPLKTVADVADALAADKHLIEGYDVEARFRQEVATVEAAIRSSLDEGHALVNGKWLVDVFAPRALGPQVTPQRCRDGWIAHAVQAGGLPEVRDLWRRLTARPS